MGEINLLRPGLQRARYVGIFPTMPQFKPPPRVYTVPRGPEDRIFMLQILHGAYALTAEGR